MELTFKLDDTAIRKKIADVTVGLNDYSEPLENAASQLLPYFSGTVFDEQRIAQEVWRPLSKATLYARDHRSGYYKQEPEATDKTLVWTGRLRRGFYRLVEPLRLTIANNVPYFQYHQERGGKTPQRRMLALTADVIIIVRTQVKNYMDSLLKK